MYQLFASKTTLFRISILSVNTLLISSAILQYRTGLIFLIMAGEKSWFSTISILRIVKNYLICLKSKLFHLQNNIFLNFSNL